MSVKHIEVLDQGYVRKKFSSVYAISSKTAGKMYVGSSVNMYKRWSQHREALRNGNHHCKHLQRAWTKYGEGDFLFFVVEPAQPEQLVEREQFWIDRLESANHTKGFNSSPTAGSSLGVKRTVEERKRMSLRLKGTKFSEVRRAKHREVVVRGENHHRAKITEQQAVEIKQMLAMGLTQRAVGKTYSLSAANISQIQNGHAWSHIAVQMPKASVLGSRHWNSILPEAQVTEIKTGLRAGETMAHLSRVYGVHFGTVSDIAKGKTWKQVA